MAFNFPNTPTVGDRFSPTPGTTYTFNGVGWTMAAGGGGPLAIQVIVASGTYTPTVGMATAVVECVGAGGGGGGAAGGSGYAIIGGGGGSGGYSRKIVTAAQVGASQTVVIGAGGAGSTSPHGTLAADGGDTSFGSLCVARGGKGGVAIGAGSGTSNMNVCGAGAPVGIGDVTAAGTPGGAGYWTQSSSTIQSSAGGTGPFGGGGTPGMPSDGVTARPGVAGANYGSGGSGANISGAIGPATGGPGSAGVCIITEFGPATNTALTTTTKIVPITASGTYTPSPGLVSAIVETVGGGGGGGPTGGGSGYNAIGGGGGSGGYSRRALTAAQIGASQAVTIGAGGVGGTYPTPLATAGGDTSFGSLVISKGGGGGALSLAGDTWDKAGLGGFGGSVTGAVGDIVAAGNNGVDGFWANVNYIHPTGGGASSALGGGARSITALLTTGFAGGNYGAGGSGAASSGPINSIGGNGSAGIIIVTEFIAVGVTTATTLNRRVLTTSQTYVPSPNLMAADVECVGGGGAGGGATGVSAQVYVGGGGGSGGYSRKTLTAAQIGASQTITIGAGGVGASAASGTAGGDTSFGSLCIAKGGGAGTFSNSSTMPTAGSGGVAGTGDVIAAGAPGNGGLFATGATAFPQVAAGGSSVFGGGGAPVDFVGGPLIHAGVNASNYGSGGSGGGVNQVASNVAGGNGSAGVCIITEYIAAVPPPPSVPAGTPVLIQRVDVASAVAQVDFTSGIDATYDEYELHFYTVRPSADANLYARFSSDGGATWVSTANYQTGFRITGAASTPTDIQVAAQTQLQLGTTQLSAATSVPMKGVIRMADLFNTTTYKAIMFDVIGTSGAFNTYRVMGTSALILTPAVNGFRFFMSTGNIAAGTFILYGIKK